MNTRIIVSHSVCLFVLLFNSHGRCADIVSELQRLPATEETRLNAKSKPIIVAVSAIEDFDANNDIQSQKYTSESGEKAVKWMSSHESPISVRPSNRHATNSSSWEVESTPNFKTIQPCHQGWFSRAKAKVQSHRAWYWGSLDKYDDPPFGCSVNQILNSQKKRGSAARMVLYHYDFGDRRFGNPDRLSARGFRQLVKIADLASRSSAPIRVQPSDGQPKLDEARREAVIVALSQIAPQIAPHRVIVPRIWIPDGISGVDAVRIQQSINSPVNAAAGNTSRTQGNASPPPMR